jgi:acetamidase/formamidase
MVMNFTGDKIKNLSRGSRCYFPVFVDGANLSVGDLHFSQGDVSNHRYTMPMLILLLSLRERCVLNALI